MILAIVMLASILPAFSITASAALANDFDMNTADYRTLAQGNIARNGAASSQFTNTFSSSTDMWPRINDGGKGTGSVHSNSWNMHNDMGQSLTGWVDITWAQPQTIGGTRVMWAADAASGTGGVQMPTNAILQYLLPDANPAQAASWAPVTNMVSRTGTNNGSAVTSVGLLRNGSAAATDPNTTWNGVTFDPVTTARFRMVITKGTAAGSSNGPGLFEWEIFEGVSDPLAAALNWATSQIGSLANITTNVALPTVFATDPTITFTYESSLLTTALVLL